MLAATVFGAWFETTTTPDTVSRRQTVQQSSRAQGRSTTAQASPAPLVPNTDRLRAYLNSPPQPTRGRNPFVYGSRMPARAVHREAAETVVPAPAVAVEPPMPIFRLSGIASNAEADAVIRTAIIIDNGSMVFAKAGDKLSNGYSVVSVDEMAVTLVDANGVTQTIRLP
jgi:hypothetical protein